MLVNEWYLRDISKRIRATIQLKAKAGKPITNKTPYGYQKDPANKHHWIVDEEAAEIVARRKRWRGQEPYQRRPAGNVWIEFD